MASSRRLSRQWGATPIVGHTYTAASEDAAAGYRVPVCQWRRCATGTSWLCGAPRANFKLQVPEIPPIKVPPELRGLGPPQGRGGTLTRHRGSVPSLRPSCKLRGRSGSTDILARPILRRGACSSCGTLLRCGAGFIYRRPCQHPRVPVARRT